MSLKSFVEKLNAEDFLDSDEEDRQRHQDPLDIFTGKAADVAFDESTLMEHVQLPSKATEPSVDIIRATDIFERYMKKSMALQFIQKVKGLMDAQPTHVQRGMARTVYTECMQKVLGMRKCNCKGPMSLSEHATQDFLDLLEDMNSRFLGETDAAIIRSEQGEMKKTEGSLQDLVYSNLTLVTAILWLMFILTEVPDGNTIAGTVLGITGRLDVMDEEVFYAHPSQLITDSSSAEQYMRWSLSRGAMARFYNDPITGETLPLPLPRNQPGLDIIPFEGDLPVGQSEATAGIWTVLTGGDWEIRSRRVRATAWGDFVDIEIPRLFGSMLPSADAMGRFFSDEYARRADENPDMPPVRLMRRLFASYATQNAETVAFHINYSMGALTLSAALISSYLLRQHRRRLEQEEERRRIEAEDAKKSITLEEAKKRKTSMNATKLTLQSDRNAINSGRLQYEMLTLFAREEEKEEKKENTQ